VRSQAPLAALHPTATWALGVLCALVGTFLAPYVPLFGVLIYAVLAAGLVLRARARAAIGGGLLLTTGLCFAYVHQSMIDRCAAMNTASGSCTVVDPNGTLIPALTFVFVGAVLSVYALFFGKRSLRGGE
jgi:hypothetical protein